MAAFRWTKSASKHLSSALIHAQKNHPADWVQTLKDAVMKFEDAIIANAVIAKRLGRVPGTHEIDLAPLPFFIVVRIKANGDWEIISFLHKRRKYP